ncbi:MAG: efflux RND transporter periplasmic adaptor subunit [Elusimicrobiota bacterium]|jgi:multidrug efflux pump subunit AcrA (membrane-fusion protein)
MNRKHIPFISILAVSLLACHRKDETPRLEAFPVRVERVMARTLEETLVLVGSLKARNEATLFPRVPGKLKENLLREGDPVEKDQSVALIERDEVGVKFEAAPVPSTLGGVVGRIYLDRGANVTLNTPIAFVVDDREVIAKADVPERYVGKISLGQGARVQVEAYADQSFQGTVSRVSPVVDTATRSAPIEVRIDNTARRLRSGMFAKMTLVTTRRPGALAVPKEAVMDDGRSFVFLVQNGQAVKREIHTGLVTERYLEVTDGLPLGATVITSSLFGLQDGSPVDVTEGNP